MSLRAQVGSTRWTFALAALTMATALSIDMSLPALPTLSRALDAPPGAAQLTLSVFMIGYALGQLVVGAWSDAHGRRRVLFWGLSLFTVAGFACAFAPTLPVLVACRAVQGLGAATGAVLGRAMVRDTHDASDAARLLATMTAVLALAPMLAPTIGGVVVAYADWRGIFVVLGVCGLALLATAMFMIDETLPVERRGALSVRSVLGGFGKFFARPGTRLPAAVLCATFAGQFAFVSASPFVLIEGYGVPPQRFGLYFGAIALALMAGSLTSSRLLRRGAAPRRILLAGAALLCTAGVLVVGAANAPALGVAAFAAPVALYVFGVGLVGPNATALAMQPARDIAGTASSSIGFLQMAAGAMAGWATTTFGGSDPRGLAIGVAAMGACALALVLTMRAADRRAPAPT